jgi:hypothetical protein
VGDKDQARPRQQGYIGVIGEHIFVEQKFWLHGLPPMGVILAFCA